MEVALRTLEGRCRWQTLGQLLVKVLCAVVIIEKSDVGENLSANFAIVCFVFIQVPRFAELSLHEGKNDPMRQSEVTTQIGDITSDEGALGTLVRLSSRQIFHHLFAEMSEKMDAFVTSFVDTRLEFFSAKFTAERKTNNSITYQSKQIVSVISRSGSSDFVVVNSLLYGIEQDPL